MSVRFDLASGIVGQLQLSSRRFDGGALVVQSTPAPYDVVFAYPGSNELRPRAEVASPASLATWAGLPIVVGHFAVDMSNVAKAIGYVRAAADGNDGWIHAELVIVDPEAVRAIEDGKLAELSGGYSVNVDASRGTWRGQSYDGVQRGHVMNHLGIGPKDWARAGSSARVR